MWFATCLLSSIEWNTIFAIRNICRHWRKSGDLGPNTSASTEWPVSLARSIRTLLWKGFDLTRLARRTRCLSRTNEPEFATGGKAGGSRNAEKQRLHRPGCKEEGVARHKHPDSIPHTSLRGAESQAGRRGNRAPRRIRSDGLCAPQVEDRPGSDHVQVHSASIQAHRAW